MEWWGGAHQPEGGLSLLGAGQEPVGDGHSESEEGMKPIHLEKKLGWWTFECVSTDSLSEISLVAGVHLETRRRIVGPDPLQPEKEVFVIGRYLGAHINLLWIRFSASWLFNRRPWNP